MAYKSNLDLARIAWPRTLLYAGLVLGAILALRQGFSMRQLIFQLALPVFLLTQALGHTLAWLRRKDRLGRATHHIAAEIEDHGGGFYGVVALLTFLHLEFKELETIWHGSIGLWSFVSNFSVDRVFDFGLDSCFNAIKAALWPLRWYQTLGWNAIWAVGLTWLIYYASATLARPWLPASPSSRDSDKSEGQ